MPQNLGAGSRVSTLSHFDLGLLCITILRPPHRLITLCFLHIYLL